ncbi:hypothetical protein BM221_000831 [Beauveria bassiana]|uniref:2EXR domain-containing protein n=1 Tax=Beauveria bassiana TaxID=176275 RepID=A0A2N6P1P7_BEABA|nr:hypothetical protein BM221_000831 [Beauveria bassiana]
MANSFHLFPSLPPEIRLRVWEGAVVDRRASQGPMTCAPHRNDCNQVDLSWQHGAKSTSEQDSSLWVTCRESRHVMKQMMKKLNRDQNAPSGGAGLSSAGGQSQRTGGFASASTGISTDDRSEKRRFTFVPDRDLFVFCPRNLLCYSLSFRLRLEDIDCVRPGERSSMDCINKFAFEIGTHWRTKHDKARITHICQRMAWGREKARIFYFIDYRLRHRKGSIADRQTTTAFQAVAGRFFEVKNDGSWGYSAEDSSEENHESIFDFVTRLRRMAEAVYGDEWSEDVSQKSFRVLAYEPDRKDEPCATEKPSLPAAALAHVNE